MGAEVVRSPDIHPTRFSRIRTLVAIALSSSFALQAASTAPPVRVEIDALLARLQASGCDFNRNGSWYNGPDARAHLARKLEYVEGKTTIRSTEQFIELGASASSTSGKPYLVKCGNAAPEPSAQWLSRELGALRGNKAP